VRSAELPKDYQILSSVDDELRERLRGNRGIAPVDSGSTIGLHSHILLAATSSTGVAREQNGRGAFTHALLNLLNEVSPDTLTYEDIIHRLPDLPNQFPQCEGFFKSRYLFNGRAPVSRRLLYRVSKLRDGFKLEAGEAQGMAAGARFNLFTDRSADTPLYATTSIQGPPLACTSLLSHPELPDGDMVKLAKVPNTLWALQTSIGDNVPTLTVALPSSNDAFMPLIRRIVEAMDQQRPDKRNISLVEVDKPHELSLRIDSYGAVFFDVNDLEANSFGVRSIAHSTSITNAEHMHTVLSSAADFFYHLRRSNKAKSLSQYVTLEAHTLQRIHSNNVWMLSNNVNLNRDGVMTVNVNEGQSYGFRLVNRSQSPLYIWAFLFDLSDLAIQTLFSPNIAKGTEHESASIQPNSELTIGYGSGGARHTSFVISGNIDVEVSYLRIFLTTTYVDLSFVAQESPFPPRRGLVRVPSKDRWDALTMTIVCKRG